MDNIPFQRVAILGVGLIGGSMGLAMRRIGFEGGIVGISRPATIERAVDLGAVDEGFGYDQLPAALDGVDLVFACSPIQHIIDTLPAVMAAAAPGTLVTDAGSTKRQIVAAAEVEGVHAYIGTYYEAITERYLAGDLAGILELSREQLPNSDDGLHARLMTRLIDDRNRRFAARLGETLSAGSAFVAVGALHLPGEAGLVALLQAEGYRVTLVDG